MRITSSLVILFTVLLSACSTPETPHEVKVTEQPFVSAGAIDMQLSGGAYQIRPAADDHIRVTRSGNLGNSSAAITIDGTSAKLEVKDTPKNNFSATIEVPKTADLVVHLSGGDLEVAAIAGNKDIETGGGNVQIAVGDPNQ